MSGFVSKVGDRLRRGAATTRIKSKEMIGVQRVRRRMARLDKERLQQLQELGQSVYEMSQAGKLDKEAINKKCAAIAELASQIKEHESQIEEVHGEAQEALERTKAE